MIKAQTLQRVMVAINKIAQVEGLEDFSKVRQDATAIETNIHYPTNNSHWSFHQAKGPKGVPHTQTYPNEGLEFSPWLWRFTEQ